MRLSISWRATSASVNRVSEYERRINPDVAWCAVRRLCDP